MNLTRLAGRARFVLCLAALAPLMTACAKQSRVVTGSVAGSTSTYGSRLVSLEVCSGYGCEIKDQFRLSVQQNNRLKLVLERGKASAASERRAIRKAIATMELSAYEALKFQTDIPFSYQRHAGKRGQMDCVDESLNTTAYLQYFHANGWLRHHTPNARFASRGILFDGRYPHKSATMRDKSGKQWAVDSWKGKNGTQPEVMELSRWYAESNNASQY